MVVATPEYLRGHGKPSTLEALQRHECIQCPLPSSGQRMPWLLRGPSGDFDHATQGSLCRSDDILGTVTLARTGAGLLQTYRFIVEQGLLRGTLKEVLQSFGGASRPFSVLYPSNWHMPLRVRVLIDFLLVQLGQR